MRVLGADGFTAANRPALDFIADFTRSSITASESVAEAIAVLSTWPDSLLVELVVSDG